MASKCLFLFNPYLPLCLHCLPSEVILNEVSIVPLSFQYAPLILTITHNNTPHLTRLTSQRHAMTKITTKPFEICSYHTLKPVLRVWHRQLSRHPTHTHTYTHTLTHTLNQGWKMHLVNSEFQAPLYPASVSTLPD